MPPLPITGLYAGIAGLMLIGLAVWVIRQRVRARVGLFDGGDDTLGRIIRIHGNFTEYVPLALLLMALVEASAAPAGALHALGVGLIGGRVVHAAALFRSAGGSRLRVLGMAATFAVIGTAGGLLIWRFLAA